MTKPIKSKAKLNKNNSTQFRGVTTLPNGKFVGQIYHEGKTHRGEQRAKAIDAARDYDKMAVEMKGDKARLNFPKK